MKNLEFSMKELRLSVPCILSPSPSRIPPFSLLLHRHRRVDEPIPLSRRILHPLYRTVTRGLFSVTSTSLSLSLFLFFSVTRCLSLSKAFRSSSDGLVSRRWQDSYEQIRILR